MCLRPPVPGMSSNESFLQVGPEANFEGRFQSGDRHQVGPASPSQYRRDGGVVEPGRPGDLAQAPLPYGVPEPTRQFLGVADFRGPFDASVWPAAFHHVRKGRASKSSLSYHAATLNQESLQFPSLRSTMVRVSTGSCSRAFWGRAISGVGV